MNFSIFAESVNLILPIIASFIVAVIGSLTKTTTENKRWPKNITFAGWILFGLSFVILGFSITAILENSKSRILVELNALLKLENTLSNSLEPFYLSIEDIGPEQRFGLVTALKPFDYDYLCDVDIHEIVYSYSPFFRHVNQYNLTWGEYLSTNAETFRRKIDNLSAAYGDYLGYDMLHALSEVSTHPYLDLMEYAHIRENRHIAEQYGTHSVTLCVNEKIADRYHELQKDYLIKLENVENMIESQSIKISTVLSIETCSPLFIRQAGNILFPDCLENN